MKFLAAALLSICLALPAAAQPNEPLLARPVELTIPEQPLADALVALSQQTGVQILMAADVVRQYQSPAVAGRMSLREALARLLQETRLSFHAAGESTVGIEQSDARSMSNTSNLDALLGDVATGSPQASVRVSLPALQSGDWTSEQLPDEGSAPAGSLAPQRSSRTIDEIVVTATKRKESVRDIPASIVALTGEDLEAMGAQGQDDFLKLSPGITLLESELTPRISVRGIASDAATNVTTGVLIGDVPFNDPYFPRVTLDPNPFDLATVEILKGPQGTLFGGGSLNGAIRYMPQSPLLETWEAKAFAQFESLDGGDNGTIMGGVINLPMFGRDDLALRLVGHQRNSSGWIDELQRGEPDVNRVTQSSGRALALWQPDDRWSLSAMHMAQQTRNLDSGFADNDEGRLTRSNTPRKSPLRTAYELDTLGIGYAFDAFDFLSQTSLTSKSYTNFNDLSRLAGDRPEPTLNGHTQNRIEGLLQELRLSSGEGVHPQWKWVGGVFYQRIDQFEISELVAGDQPLPVGGDQLDPLILGADGTISSQGQPSALLYQADIRAEELALFGEATRAIGQAWDITLGLRAYRVNLGGTITKSGAIYAFDTFAQGQAQDVVESHIRERGINPKLAIEYAFSDGIQSYLSIARGFRFGGIQILGDSVLADIPETFKADTLWSYELGLRTQWLGNTLIADLVAFHVDWKDPQLAQLTQGVFGYIDNVAGARSDGVELAVQYLPPVDGLSLSLSAAYIETVSTADFTSANGNDIPAGSSWPQAPLLQTASTATYERPLGNWLMIASLVHAYLGRGWNDLDHTLAIFDYQTLDFGLSFSDQLRPTRPRVSLQIANLGDERGLAGGGTAPTDRAYIRPRTAILRLAFEI